MAHDSHTTGCPLLPYLTTLCTHHSLTPSPSSSSSSSSPPVGLKLDFKDLRAVEPTLLTLSSLLPPSPSPSPSPSHLPNNPLLWLNADVLQGPLGPPPTLPAPAFVALARRHFPDAILSLGWTTSTPTPSPSPSPLSPLPPPPATYTPAMVRAMVEVCEAQGVTAVTFPVRARYVRGSWEGEGEGGQGGLRALVEGQGREGWSLTVWSNVRDGEEQGVEERAEERDWLLSHLPLQRTFFDLVS